jgi:nitrogen-specific signal transduction histidine kinase
VVFHRSAKLQITTEALSLEKETLIAELHTQVAHAEQANTEKTQFLTAVSHDVRQPAHALLLLSRTVMRQMEQLANVHPVQTTARHLHSAAQELHTMLDGLVDVARLQAGALKPKCQTVELDVVLQRVHSLFAGIAEHREQVLRVRLNGATVWADPELLFRMICNLVDNALKFSPPDACVWVGARRSGAQWRLEVRDSGPGIPPEAQERIFAAFVQLHHGPNRVAGIGYGLTVVRQFARLQKLRLGLRSCPLHGSCFWIELPTAEDPSLQTQPLMIAHQAKRPSSHAQVRPILLLDDDMHTREATAAWLQTAGFQVQAHANEAAALLALSRGATGLNEAGAVLAPYALAILDINLAQGLNIDALLVLLCQFHPPVPCIIVSAGPKPRDLPKEVVVFSKPVDADVLLEAVERLCQPQANAQRKL